MVSVVPLPMARIYLFAVGANETLLSAYSGRVELIWVLWVGTRQMWLVCGRHIALSVAIDGGGAVALLYMTERNSCL